MINVISPHLDGSEVADEYIQQVYDGAISLSEAHDWVAELRREGFGELAAAVTAYLPLPRARAH